MATTLVLFFQQINDARPCHIKMWKDVINSVTTCDATKVRQKLLTKLSQMGCSQTKRRCPSRHNFLVYFQKSNKL